MPFSKSGKKRLLPPKTGQASKDCSQKGKKQVWQRNLMNMTYISGLLI
jgi:hypothetical protein